MAEEASNLFDAVRRANRAVWEQASGRKPSDESRAIPPPTGRESPLEGADASAMVAALSAKLNDLQARVDFIEDDFPETDVSDVGGGDSVYPHTLSVVSVESQKIRCSSGWWTHINNRYEIADKIFWFGPANECDDEWIWLPGGYGRCYVFVEVPSSEWSYTRDTDALYGGSTYMRRCIFSARISLHQEISELIVHNAGDIYT